jgi:3-isopropylmalate/(R)-2-methylmalate dehydratase small subunit
LPVIVDDATHHWLMANAGSEVEIDLPASVLRLPGGREISFPIEPFARYCLMNGIDELDFLLGKTGQIEAFEARHA